MLAFGSRSSAASEKVLVVAESADEFTRAMDALRVPYESVAQPCAAPDLDMNSFAAVIVCAASHKRPLTLPRSFVEKLEAYVRRGGRALVEFTVPESGTLFGVGLGKAPTFARHERIVVSSQISSETSESCRSKIRTFGHDLSVDTLLDEQYSYVLPIEKLPARSERVLDYGEFVGTYKLKPVRSRFYEFWVDLGTETTISFASQRYGGLNPHYCPDKVELLVGPEPDKMELIASKSGGWQASPTAEFSFTPRQARYVLFRCSRDDSGPGEYWFFAGEIAVRSTQGENVALGKPTRILTPVSETPWGPSKLTDGQVDGPFSDGKSIMIGAVGSEFGQRKWPALVRIGYARGTALLLTAKISDWRHRRFRPSVKWDLLIHTLCVELLPDSLRERALEDYVPLTAATEPRRWVPSGESARLIVTSRKDAKVLAKCASLTLGPFRQKSPGRWEARIETVEGEHSIVVTVRVGENTVSTTVPLLVADRKAAYERAILRNAKWFLESGIMPKKDGTAGVYSTIFTPSPNDGPQEDLPGPIRTDNLAMIIDAFIAFNKLTKDAAWLERAAKLGDILASSQRLDRTKANYGSFPWILGADFSVKDSTIWFHDNETRCAAGLLNLYVHTRDPKYLLAALRSVELAMDVSQEDYTIANHSISADALNAMGRAAYRKLANYTLKHYDLQRWFSAYAATGDEKYREAAATIARLYATGSSPHTGSHVWAIAPYAVKLLGKTELAPKIDAYARAELKKPDIARFGVDLTRGPGNYELLYRNDCTINTDPEPLADLLYTAPMALRRAWFAYKASGSKAALEIYTKLADFLVRIQLENESPQVDGCWVRGFDTELWEDFGAPYDPNYGPYHAYSGWMNSIISEGLAFYVLDTDPFQLHQDLWESARKGVEEVRSVRPPEPRQHQPEK